MARNNPQTGSRFDDFPGRWCFDRVQARVLKRAFAEQLGVQVQYADSRPSKQSTNARGRAMPPVLERVLFRGRERR